MDQTILLDMISAIYGAAEAPQQWGRFLDLFGTAVSSQRVGFVLHDLGTAKASLTMTGIDRSEIARYESYYSTTNPWLKRSPQYLTVDNVHNGLQTCPPELVQRSEFYADWGRPNGMFHSFGGTISKVGSLACYITACRPENEPEFDDSNVRTLQTLMPHLKRALSIQQKLATINALEGGVDSCPYGVFILDLDGCIELMNSQAEKFLGDRSSTLIVRNGRLTTSRSDTASTLRDMIRGCDQIADRVAGSSGLFKIDRSDRSPICITISPLRSPQRWFTHIRQSVLVLIHEVGKISPPNREHLVNIFGYTRAEAAIALGLFAGQTVEELAVALRISVFTARAHVRSIFRKTDVNRQSELISILASCPR
jgi:DNA-binding CsgD family transcriptional regulator/PAS domain-containing protein